MRHGGASELAAAGVPPSDRVLLPSAADRGDITVEVRGCTGISEHAHTD